MDILQKQRDYYLMRFLAETKERIPTRRYDELHSCWLGSFQVDILFFFMTFLEKWLSRIPKDRNLLDDTTPPFIQDDLSHPSCTEKMADVCVIADLSHW